MEIIQLLKKELAAQLIPAPCFFALPSPGNRIITGNNTVLLSDVAGLRFLLLS